MYIETYAFGHKCDLVHSLWSVLEWLLRESRKAMSADCVIPHGSKIVSPHPRFSDRWNTHV